MGLPPLDAVADGLADHVCLAADGPGGLIRAAVPYLRAGLEAGQHAVVVAPASHLELAARLAGAAGPAGRVQVVPADAVYERDGIDVDATLTRIESTLASALATGRTGLRAVSMLLEPPAPAFWASLAGWELAVDRWHTTRPVAFACAVDRQAVGDGIVHEIACLHPRVLTSGSPVPFQLFHRRGRLVLEGEVDTFSAPLLARALGQVRVEGDERIVVDARGLRFVNHRGVQAIIDGLARRHPAGVTLAGAPSVPLRLLESLGVNPAVLDVLPSPW